MALINCPDCGKEVSTSAASCPNCGCPIAQESDSGYVKIKFPAHIDGVKDRLFSKNMASVSGGGVSWVGEYGATARFKVDGPTKVWVDLGRAVGCFDVVVYPNTNYRVESYESRWGILKFELVEI